MTHSRELMVLSLPIGRLFVTLQPLSSLRQSSFLVIYWFLLVLGDTDVYVDEISFCNVYSHVQNPTFKRTELFALASTGIQLQYKTK